MIEIEKRVLVNKKESAKLFKFLKTNAKFTRDFKRFSLVKVERQDFVPDKENPIDIRIRTTKEGGKFALKYGNWHGSSSREEYEIGFKTEEIKDLVNMLRVLEYKYFIMTYIHRYEFGYKVFKITLDKYYSSDTTLMEIEVVAGSRKGLNETERKMDEFLKSQNLKPLDSKGMVKYIEGLNNIKRLRVDFTKTTVEEWYKKWKDYIYCLK